MSAPFAPVSATAAATALRAAGARGFLGADPVTQNDALVARTLTGAQLFTDTQDAAGVAGFRPNPDNPRQADIATTATDPATVVAFTRFLHERHRATSFTATAGPGDAVLLGSGFTEVARLREHVFRGGRFADVAIYHLAAPPVADLTGRAS